MAMQTKESILAEGELMTLRIWRDEEPTADSPEETRPYETVGYVISGAMEVSVDGKSKRVAAGDSYVVPRDARHKYVILERLTAVEAVARPRG